jgi:translation initiation factor 2B subunit (eIF-2B alpha/beta/delta family)
MTPTLDHLLKAKTPGSFNFCISVLQYLHNYLRNSPIKNMNSLAEDLNKQGKMIIKMHPNMASLRKKIVTVIYTLKKAMRTPKTIDEVKIHTQAKIQELINLAQQKKEIIANAGSKLVTANATIVTIGNSTLVAEILLTAYQQKRKFEVYCLHSAPGGEGLELAENLSRNGITCYVSSDAAMGTLVGQASLILVGTVRIYENGFVNKLGTLPLAIAAQYMKLPFYLAGETDKIMSENEYAVRFYQQDTEELYPSRYKKIKVFNTSYESIPHSMVTKFITEDGVFDPVEFKNWYLKD